MKKTITYWMFAMLFAFVGVLSANAQKLNVTELRWEQLADMNTARMAHRIFPSGDNFVVVGGHTTGFEREQSAEIYKDGAWQYVTPGPSVPHDNAGSVTLADGRTLVFGGLGGDSGTGGGIMGIDIYDPATESFSAAGSMTTGRTMCNGVAVGDKVFMMGAYMGYSEIIDVWSNGSVSALENSLNNGDMYPYLLPKSDETAFLVVGNAGRYSYLSTVDKVDTSTGEITQITMNVFDEWKPWWPGEGADTPDFSIGNGRYLLLCQNMSNSEAFGVVLVDADAETAQLLLTLPSQILNDRVSWSGYLITNPAKGEAYVIKSIKVNNDSYTYFIATIDYNNGVVKEIATAEELPVSGVYSGFAILSDGRILVTGGSKTGESNFDAHNMVFALTPNGGTVISSFIPINETNFPDEIFRNYLLSQDYGSDGMITDEEIAEITCIDVEERGIASLKGIELFTALTTLWCGVNQLTTIDVSKNTALTTLICIDNQLTSLDVSKNTVLTYLDCDYNQLTSLDVSKNAALESFYCGVNQLTSLDVSKNTALTDLGCAYNQLTSLDVSKNTVLTYLFCHVNQLTSLDVSNNTALEWLDCSGNQLTSLDVSKNTVLTYLECDNNQIKGSAMDAFVESLPNVNNGEMYVIWNEDEGNVMTITQVAAAKAKGWIPYYYDGTDWQEYAGSDPSGIEALKNSKVEGLKYYDLQGRRVVNPTKGVYIINGRKVVLKNE